MAAIWVTRSEPGASELGRLLKQHGFAAWVAPVLEVVPLSPWCALFNGTVVDPTTLWLEPGPGLVICLSAHAARNFMDNDLLAHAGNARFLAVGEHTASELFEAGINARVPAVVSSEGLLHMPEVARLGADETVWILAGESGRDLLLAHLRDVKHCRVIKFELYRRRSISAGPIEQHQIGAVVAASLQGLEAFAVQWRAVLGGDGVPLIVPSTRVAGMAAEMGFVNVHTADNASAESTLAVVRLLSL